MKKVITSVFALLLVLGGLSAQVSLGTHGWEAGQGFDLYTPEGAGYTYTVKSDATKAHSGSGYAECVVSALPANMWDLQIVPGGLVVEPNKPYRFEVWTKATGTAPTANFTCGHYSYSDIPGISKYGVKVGTEWQRVNLMLWLTPTEVAAIPVDGGVSGKIRFPIHVGAATGTYLFDDFSFTQSALAYGEVVGNKVTLNFGWEIGLTDAAITSSAFTVKSGENTVAITAADLVNIGTEEAPINIVQLTLARSIAANEVIKVACDGANSGIEYAGSISPITDNFMVLSFNETIKNMSSTGTGIQHVNASDLKMRIVGSNLHIERENVNSISVFNLDGKVLAQSTAVNSVSIDRLSKGSYIVKVVLADNVFTSKFIK